MTKGEAMNTMTLADWHTLYFAPMKDVALGVAEPSEVMLDGFAGFVLDGILAIKGIGGHEASDWECVEMVGEFISYAKLIEGKF